jgi:hypothetical protein
MADYTVTLTPALINLASEGSLDTSVVGGVSIQRTFNAVTIVNGTNRKVVGRLEDGDTFSDVVSNYADYPNVDGNPQV